MNQNPVTLELGRGEVSLALGASRKRFEVQPEKNPMRRELLALLRGLAALNRPVPLRVRGASRYLRGVLERVLEWEQRGFVGFKHPDLLRQVARYRKIGGLTIMLDA